MESGLNIDELRSIREKHFSERLDSRKKYLNEDEFKITEDLDDILIYYGYNKFPNENFEIELFESIRNVMINNNQTDYTIEWSTKNSKITGMKGLFHFSGRKPLAMLVDEFLFK